MSPQSETHDVGDPRLLDGRPATLARADRRTDAQLLAEVQGASTEALAALYGRYGARAYRVARSVCVPADAEDAVQEAFVAVWRGAAGYRPARGVVAAWLITIVHHRAIDVARRQGRHAANCLNDPGAMDAKPAPLDVAAQAVLRADAPRLRRLLTHLPREQGQVIALAFYGGLTHVEIATQLGLPIGTVKGRMRLGLQRLRGDVEEGAA